MEEPQSSPCHWTHILWCKTDWTKRRKAKLFVCLFKTSSSFTIIVLWCATPCVPKEENQNTMEAEQKKETKTVPTPEHWEGEDGSCFNRMQQVTEREIQECGVLPAASRLCTISECSKLLWKVKFDIMDPTQQFPCVQLCLIQKAYEHIDCKPLVEKGFKNELCILTKRKTLYGESVFIQQLKTPHLFQNINPRSLSSVVKPLESCLSRRNNC